MHWSLPDSHIALIARLSARSSSAASATVSTFLSHNFPPLVPEPMAVERPRSGFHQALHVCRVEVRKWEEHIQTRKENHRIAPRSPRRHRFFCCQSIGLITVVGEKI